MADPPPPRVRSAAGMNTPWVGMAMAVARSRVLASVMGCPMARSASPVAGRLGCRIPWWER